MPEAPSHPVVTTVPGRCRVCYTCVRECPGKAIRVTRGQAEVLPRRCTACGRCVRVCRQSAKRVAPCMDELQRLLAGEAAVALCLDPAWAAEFDDWPADRLPSALRGLGFRWVHDGALGADLVARAYRDLVRAAPGRAWISSTCPAVTGQVARFNPGLSGRLAPVVSPMIATARAVRAMHGPEIRVVHAGPCVARKAEARQLPGEVDLVLTFSELRLLLESADVPPEGTAGFDPPTGGDGGLLALSRGLLQVAGLDGDPVHTRCDAAAGRLEFLAALRDAETEGEAGSADLLEILACDACTLGPGSTSEATALSRARSVRRQAARQVAADGRAAAERFADLDVSRTFRSDDQRLPAPDAAQLRELLARTGKSRPEDELDCGACGYETCREHAVATYKGLAEPEMCLPYALERLRDTVRDLAVAHDRLATTQEALSQSERLGGLGRLASSLAREVSNPLGTVLLQAHLLLDCARDRGDDVRDLMALVEGAERCKRILSGLRHFSTEGELQRRFTDLRELVDWAAGALPEQGGVELRVRQRHPDVRAELDPDRIMEVLRHLLHNALAAMPDGGRLTVELDGAPEEVVLAVSDTGVGIAREHLRRVFEPFFSTRPSGTGLGLAVAYGIVKMHSGEISVTSNDDPAQGPTGTTFRVVLPRRGAF